jgi:hypothetical protein
MTKPKTRRVFRFAEYRCARIGGRRHEANRILFEWLCDDGDRAALYKHLKGKALAVPTRVRHEDDPAPPLSQQPLQGHEHMWLLTGCKDIEHVLENAGAEFSNLPYRLLGTGTFMLGLDPTARPDWHGIQRGAGIASLNVSKADVDTMVALAFEQAAVLSLARKRFDLAELAEQAALRFCGVLFGFASSDHALLEDALRRGYRALTYINLGRHFVSEPDTLPAAREALARLMRRADELLGEYNRLERYPNEPSPYYAPSKQRDDWPVGVTPPSDHGLSGWVPVLKQWGLLPCNPLSGEQLAVIVVGMLVGIVGNVQASVCIAVEHILKTQSTGNQPQDVAKQIDDALLRNPPVAFLPRLVLKQSAKLPSGATLPKDAQVVLCLGAATQGPCSTSLADLIFGGEKGLHRCIGQHLAGPLIKHVVSRVLRLPGLAHSIDAVDGDAISLSKRWGFACESFPLEYRRDRRLAQQPLQVIMRIKSPVADNAARLRRLIRDGAPKIERALREARHVHFAWFQLIEGDTQLVLQTVYDGDFDAYIQHFALKVDDVFDQLFQYIEDAPPLPVGDFPEAFVETIRRFNRAPTAGYFFSAYPHHEVWNILRYSRSDL